MEEDKRGKERKGHRSNRKRGAEEYNNKKAGMYKGKVTEKFKKEM